MPSPASKPSPRQIPAQTITISSDQLGKELADRLTKALAGLYVSVGDGHELYVRCDRNDEPEFTAVDGREVIALVRAALEHECPGDPRG